MCAEPDVVDAIVKAATMMVYTRAALGLDAPTREEAIWWTPLLTKMESRAMGEGKDAYGIFAGRIFATILDEHAQNKTRPFSSDEVSAVSAALRVYEQWLRSHFPV